MAHSHAPEPLPAVVYSIVAPEALLPARVTDHQVESFGFNNGAEWDGNRGGDKSQVEGRYLRWLQPMESELARQVEYDMDEQDQIWLDNVNAERRRDGVAAVSYEVFEIIFDKLEKEWFDLTKTIPKKTNAMPNEDSKCAICDDGECEHSNGIVFCDGCNLAVHQDCYGVPYIPEGQWLCRKCTVSPDKPVTCVLCPNSYGAFKQTTTAQWAHLLCAIWIPDTGVSNTVYMEPIDGVENISKNRWKLICYLCRKRVGACIQCANRNCFQAFHVTCAREAGLELRMKQGTERGELQAYCEKHSENFTSTHSHFTSTPSHPSPGPSVTPLKRSHKRKDPNALPPRLTPSTGMRIILKAGKSSKSARAYKKSYKYGPPLVPAFVYDRVMEYVARIKVAKKPGFVSLVCRYWSLKREARRGAPLLKRLHLEPWTASATSRHQTDTEKAKKLELIRLLREDLENVRMLTERVRKREKKKLERVQLHKSVMDGFVFAKDKVMRGVLERVALLDKQHYFGEPVSRLEVPDYYDVIKHPMDWSTMREKLDRHEYCTATDFQDDIELVINNARMYNKTDTPVHKAAVRLREAAEPILAELESLDRADSLASHLALETVALLTPDTIDALFAYHYDAAVPEVKLVEEVPVEEEAVVKEPVVKGKKEEGGKKSRKKRSAEQAGLVAEDVVRSSPRTRGTKVVAEVELVAEAPVDAPPTRGRARDAGRAKARTEAAEKKAAEEEEKVEEKVKVVRAPKTTLQPVAMDVDMLDKSSHFKHFEQGWVLPEGTSRRRGATVVSQAAAPAPPSQAAPTPAPPPTPIASTSRRTRLAVAAESAPPPPPPPARSRSLASRSAPSRSRKGKEKAVAQDEPPTPLPSARLRRSAMTPPPSDTSELTELEDLDEDSPAAQVAVEGSVEEVEHVVQEAVDDAVELVEEAVEEAAVEEAVEDPVEALQEVPGEAEAEQLPEDATMDDTTLPETGPSDAKEQAQVSKGKSPRMAASDGFVKKRIKRGGLDSDGWTKALVKWKESVREQQTSVELKPRPPKAGTLVWAKTPGFPTFPAELAGSSTREKFLDVKPTGVNASDVLLVIFFDDKKSAAWCPRKDVHLLGVNEEMDRLMQSPIAIRALSKSKKTKGPRSPSQMLEDVKKAYVLATKGDTAPTEEGVEGVEGEGEAVEAELVAEAELEVVGDAREEEVPPTSGSMKKRRKTRSGF